MKPRQKRMFLAGVALAGVVVAAALAINALRGNMAYFFSPSQVVAGAVQPGEPFRLGGMVRSGTLEKSSGSLESRFIVTDNVQQVAVSYAGILPDLFKEGQGTVARGELGRDGIFYAEEVLAKHDESYMPPEVADAMQPMPYNKDGTRTPEPLRPAAAGKRSMKVIRSEPVDLTVPLHQVEINNQ